MAATEGIEMKHGDNFQGQSLSYGRGVDDLIANVTYFLYTYLSTGLASTIKTDTYRSRDDHSINMISSCSLLGFLSQY
jgi:hypothetical protein